jgi:serine/threonine protein kinase
LAITLIEMVVAGADAKQLGRYEVLKHLASGGMAQVLLARATGIEGFERYVVIKRIHRERTNDVTAVKMFLDEARLAASLHHHNIVQVHDIGQEHGEYFFAMEYVHGEDLRTLLTKLNKRREYLPFEHLMTIVTAAAAALHYAHEHRGPDRKPLHIVHRDITPANIIVGYDGQVKVVDFGIAKAAIRTSATQSGRLKGKISYMAPEQCLAQPIDRRSDVFALGIVLWELVTVRRLFKGPSEFLTMSAIVGGDPPRPSTVRADVPVALESIIMKALALDPAQRYQTAEEMRLALEEFAAGANARSSPSALGDYMAGLFGRRPEPWLVDDDEAEIEIVDVDFDGDAPAVVTGFCPIPTPPSDSLLARAQRKLTASDVTLDPSARSDAGTEPTSGGTPMAWTSTMLVRSPNRWRWQVAIGAVAVLAVIVVSIVARSSEEDTGAAVAPAAAPPPPPAAAPPPPPVVAPASEPAAPAPAVTPPVADEPPLPTVTSAEPPAEQPAKRKKTTRPRSTKQKKKKTETKPVEPWNPDTLFLKKKKP